jgi:hypothetical protein
VLFTDGWSNRGPDPAAEARLARAEDAFLLFTVSVEASTNRSDTNWALPPERETLEAVVGGNPRNAFFSSEDFARLVEVVQQRGLPCFQHQA